MYTEDLALMKFIRIKAMQSKQMEDNPLLLQDHLMEEEEDLVMQRELVDSGQASTNSEKP